MGDKPRDEQDPFEDLDQFFAPIEDDDWPEGEGGLPPPPPPPEVAGTYPPPQSGERGDALADLDDLEIDLPDEDDLFADAPAAGAPVDAAAGPPPDIPAAASTPPAGGDEAPRGQEWDLETGEMAGEEWDRLRAEALAAGAGETGTEHPSAEPSLSEEDLSTAPPQYADLPGPGAGTGDEPSGPVLEDPISGAGAEDDEGVFGPEDTGTSVLTPAAEAEEPPVADDEPAPATVEAAADHFATGMRSPEEVERELLSDLGDGGDPETVRIEPTSPVVTAEPTRDEPTEPATDDEAAAATAAPVAGRNTSAALVSGILLAAAVIALLAIGTGPFAVLVVLAVLLAQAELYAVMRTRGLQPATLLGLVCGGVMLGGAYLNGEGALLLGPALAVGLTVPWYMALEPASRRHIAANAGATIFGLMYVSFLGSFAMLLLRGPDGQGMFLVVLGLTVVYDVTAYAIGTMFGNRPLAPTISPHKSWEGVIGATLVVLLFGLALVPNIAPFSRPGVGAGPAVGLALVIALVAPLGDLVESALKRDLGVKDMGSLLPGHGGMLDRIDAVLFVVPAAYFLARIVIG